MKTLTYTSEPRQAIGRVLMWVFYTPLMFVVASTPFVLALYGFLPYSKGILYFFVCELSVSLLVGGVRFIHVYDRHKSIWYMERIRILKRIMREPCLYRVLVPIVCFPVGALFLTLSIGNEGRTLTDGIGGIMILYGFLKFKR